MPMYNPQIDPLKEVDENVLRRIQELHRGQRRATVGAIAEMTGMTRSSVYTSIRRMESKGDIEKVAYERARRDDLKLTPSGEERASKILIRHDLVLNWLKRLGISEDEAETEACHMEHGLTDNTLAAIKNHVDTAMLRMMDGGKMPCGGTQTSPPSELMGLFQIVDNAETASKLVGAIQGAGGVDSCLQKLAVHQELEQKYGGSENLMMALDLLTSMGDLQSLAQLFNVVREVGNVPALIDLFDKERRLWRSYLLD